MAGITDFIMVTEAREARERTLQAIYLQEKERERISFETMKRVVQLLEEDIQKQIEKGKFTLSACFKEQYAKNSGYEKKWKFFKDRIPNIIDIFTSAGYNISWIDTTNDLHKYGYFDISWEE